MQFSCVQAKVATVVGLPTGVSSVGNVEYFSFFLN